MEYEAVKPDGALTDAVVSVWYLDMPRTHVTEQVLPMPAVEIIVNLSDPYVLSTTGVPRSPTAAVFATGIRSKVVQFENPERIRHLAIRMPIFGPSRFGIAPGNTISALQGDLRDALDEIRDATVNNRIRSPVEALEATVDALRTHLLAESEAQRSVRGAVELLSNDSTLAIADVARSVGLSHKTLIARFRRVA